MRELSVIQRGTGDSETAIGDGSFIMDHCHVAHDVTIAADVTMSPNVVLGGHSHVLDGATLGIGAVTHQFSTVGAYAMIGMGAVVTRDVPPFCLVAGNPARFRRLNTHALEANGWSGDGAAHRRRRKLAASPHLQACLDEFALHARRKVLSLQVAAALVPKELRRDTSTRWTAATASSGDMGSTSPSATARQKAAISSCSGSRRSMPSSTRSGRSERQEVAVEVRGGVGVDRCSPSRADSSDRAPPAA